MGFTTLTQRHVIFICSRDWTVLTYRKILEFLLVTDRVEASVPGDEGSWRAVGHTGYCDHIILLHCDRVIKLRDVRPLVHI